MQICWKTQCRVDVKVIKFYKLICRNVRFVGITGFPDRYLYLEHCLINNTVEGLHDTSHFPKSALDRDAVYTVFPDRTAVQHCRFDFYMMSRTPFHRRSPALVSTYDLNAAGSWVDMLVYNQDIRDHNQNIILKKICE